MQIDKSKIDYVLEHFIKMFSGIDLKSLKIGYESDNKIQILLSERPIRKPLEEPKHFFWKGKNIPVFYGEDLTEPILFQDDKAFIKFDVIKNAFLFLSGIIDLEFNKNRDKVGRYLYKESFHEKHNLIDFPIVNYYFDILKLAVEKVYEKSLITRYKDINVALSHDIDKCNSGWLEDGFYALKKGRVDLFLKFQYYKWIRQKDTWFNFSEILEKEREHQIKSTFFFLTARGKQGKLYNADYKFSSKKLKRVYLKIENQGSEVGLHGSFGSAFSASQFEDEKLKLEANILLGKIDGNRFHFLCWDQEVTPGIIEKSGLNYDMSAAYPDKPGFKSGFCFPSRYYNFKENRSYEFVEVPLILMDSTVYEQKYLALKENKSLELANQHIDECVKHNGIFTLLWHNTYYTNHKYRGRQGLLWKIIDRCKAENASFNTVRNIVKQWETD